ncbi:hypothetical protein PCASD_11444 [Puccinia coronata f. sp. avenae]|uniref:Uncharacterized protein n=1 Tax=Puccinia coronata f. sp. avenae TaxID=200324 RepID=A0A2N5V0P6_9BASI|nr:hypothetical protein PCASD_11444 [Puccinia coronata f. sp. avenae]
MVMSSDELLALWENLHQLSLNNYWNTEERNLLSQVGERLKKSIESSDSEDEGPPKQSTSTNQPAIIPRPSPTNPQQSSNSVNNTPASKSHRILAGGSRVSEDTLYCQRGTNFLSPSNPISPKKAERVHLHQFGNDETKTPFNREAWLAEKWIRQQEQMTYNYRHSSYHNNMPANWSNYAELSDRDAEGEMDNEDAMDLDPEVGSSHPKSTVTAKGVVSVTTPRGNVGQRRPMLHWSPRPIFMSAGPTDTLEQRNNVSVGPADVTSVYKTDVTSVAATDLAAGGCNRYNPFGGAWSPAGRQICLNPSLSIAAITQSLLLPIQPLPYLLPIQLLFAQLPIPWPKLKSATSPSRQHTKSQKDPNHRLPGSTHQHRSIPRNSIAFPSSCQKAQLRPSRQAAEQINDSHDILSHIPYHHFSHPSHNTSP